ncbi:MAG: hypothetical protein WCA37_09920 [Terracidiphilus sp.]
MPSASISLTLPRILLDGLFATAMLGTMCAVASGQAASSGGAATQVEAMQKLAFLAGHWSGPVTIARGPGEPLHLTQTENVEYKLDGQVMLIEGKSTGADGKVQFQALATIAYDESSHSYRFRAYHDGHYVDAELTVLADGFRWGFDAGPAHITNTMHLTKNGEWQETSEVAFGNHPAVRSVDMLLHHEP